MKFLFFKMLVVWRRMRHGMQARYMDRQDVGRQLEVLMRRIDAAASWHERANWMIDVAEWLRHRPAVSLLDRQSWHKVRRQRLAIMLDWLDQHRDVRREVQKALQKTLREATGPELFSTTGLPHEPGFFGELSERLARLVLPRHLSPTDLSSLFTAMFPDPEDAAWLVELDNELLVRLWKLMADDGISHMYWQQIEEAITYLTMTVVADGISPAFRQRLEPKMPMRATPFLALRREMETWLRAQPGDLGALRSVRMLVAVCHAQTDRIYAHLDEYGVSVSLVYRVERMRAHLQRIGRLIDVRSGVPGPAISPAVPGLAAKAGAGRMQLLLCDLISAHHHRDSVRGLMRRSFALLARKMVERNADHREQAIARDGAGYRKVMRAGLIGGAVIAGTALVKTSLSSLGVGHFVDGALASLNYAASFLLIAALGGVLATRQPAVTAPALASRMGELDGQGMRELIAESGQLLRSQSAGIFGNLLAVVPVTAALCALGWFALGGKSMPVETARQTLASLSLVGPTPLYAALTGILLWLASLAAGFADNWFALRRVREVVSNHRRLVHGLGAMRAQRCAAWLERNVATIAGSLALAVLLGMAPVVAAFFSLPLDIRHVSLAAGALTAAAFSLGWESLMTPAFWLAAGGVAITALLSVAVAFACALALALRSRDLPRRARNVAMRAVLRRFVVRPWYFILPERSHAALQDEAEDEQDDDDDEGDDAGAADGKWHQASLVQSDDLHHQASRHVA
ncbi:preprotein translocase subunit TatB [Herbaspirillum sp. BH-1]|uniref:Site-specific recombinase n=2 Tax=Herbaspirillum frisingense TaxID=92645 RepID=A0ABU1PKU8_9BURK|nr:MULTISPECIES: preprotein translocase subunit TatB [Herbaspirillum]MDR6586553.1 site-specific recombinase [Herbaspirillum frisingense]ONN68213.1 preprotein translocase subunit TatB [Herbaspirillum sp. VT-16-41]PLY61531.1 preprotein translocase subunit TatB [Herbaspirillum sp. BH-1]